METIVSGVIVLCMFYQGGIIEHTYIQDQKMSSCLKSKRVVERSVNPENVRMQCGEVDAIIERLNTLETDNTLMKSDLEKAVEFSIKWPRGELGSLPADSEQFLLIESLLTDVEDIQSEIKESRHNAVNILRLQKDVEKILEQIEILKDKVRNNGSYSK